jgi:hypothetical protein
MKGFSFEFSTGIALVLRGIHIGANVVLRGIHIGANVISSVN